MRMRSWAAVAALVGALVAGGPQPASAAGTNSCARPARAEVFREGGVPVLDWRENLEFDGRGTLWVSHSGKGRVEGYGPDGRLRASLPVAGPGALRRGSDGMMYVNYGVHPLAGDGGILRFDPTAAQPRPQKVVGGLHGINGLAIDGDGNFYLSRELATGILKIRPDGSRDDDWTRRAGVFGTNGLEIVGDQLYASVLADATSRVVRIPLAAPERHSVVARLSDGLLHTRLLDDLTAFHDGSLVVASFRYGRLVEVDPATGRSCTLVDGLHMPTSVRVPRGFGGADPQRELFVSEASGRIVKITVG
ncbi:hypothetical protein [Streptomyces sp. NPDC049555]|uniref:SMP-30/gluconolactonase/LRE family protein n=1 Tax=Streptomyces sp. NPDC049555 TaxID=3154930 RepID=UPI003424601D